MNRIKKTATIILPVFCIFILILDAKTALNGAIEGVDICIKTIVPSLFPFFFLSGFVINNLGALKTSKKTLLSRLCKIPIGSESIILLGFVGGYPIGAEAVQNAYHNGSISKRSAERMLGFCNNAGPAFIFGIAGSLFDVWYTPWIIWLIIILSSVLTAVVLPSAREDICKLKATPKRNPFDSALKAISKVCGWVILFRVLIAVLNRWVFWLVPKQIAVLLTGLLELANGCIDLYQIQNPSFQIIAVTAMLSFGGLCVGLQTISVAKDLSCKMYFLGKTIQNLIAVALSYLTFLFYSKAFTTADMIVILLCITTLTVITVLLRKNNSGKYELTVV